MKRQVYRKKPVPYKQRGSPYTVDPLITYTPSGVH
jgi:hypothetical protein